MQTSFIKYALLSGLTVLACNTALADDSVVCSTQNKILVCNLDITNFMQIASHLLTNGWENRIDIQIDLIDKNNEHVKTTALHATQRCYIDPFDSPCLVLWRGASTWRTYKNENTFIDALSHLTVHVMKLDGLQADNYSIRTVINVRAGSDHQQASVKKWFRQTGSDDTRMSDSSLIGSFISAYTPETIDMSRYIMTLQTEQFYIDPNL
jgi:hypothetical protein